MIGNFSFEITPGKGSKVAFALYTQGAQHVIFFAREEASRYGSAYIESEHLLLGILRENEKVATRIAGRTVSLAEVRKEVEALTSVRQPVTGPVEVQPVPLGADSKRILNFAAEEALGLGHKQVFLGHFLPAILRVENSVASRILQSLGATILGMRENAIRDMRWADA